MAGRTRGRISPARPTRDRRHRRHRGPQGGRRVAEPEVHVAVHGQRDQGLQLVGLEPGRSEERQPRRQLGTGGVRAQVGPAGGQPLCGARNAEQGTEPSERLRLPRPLRGQRGTPARRRRRRQPGGDHGRPGTMRSGRTARPGGGRWRNGGCPGAGSSRGRPRRLTTVEVDSTAAPPRPRRGTRRRRRAAATRLGGPATGRCGRVDRGALRQRGRDQPPRRREVDAGADAVAVGSGSAAEPVGEGLGQPPLDASGRDPDDLGRERVGQRPAQQVGEARDQLVAVDGPVQVQSQWRAQP